MQEMTGPLRNAQGRKFGQNWRTDSEMHDHALGYFAACSCLPLKYPVFGCAGYGGSSLSILTLLL
jgi:hypothetical protein